MAVNVYAFMCGWLTLPAVRVRIGAGEVAMTGDACLVGTGTGAYPGPK